MKKRDVFWGLLLIAAAVLIILNQLGYFAGVSMFDIVASVVLGGIVLLSLIHFNFWGILFPLAGICIIFAEQWHITEFTPWPALLTALLLSIGLSMIFPKHGHWHWHHYHNYDHHQNNHTTFGSNVVNEQDSNTISCSASFGECIKYVNSSNFEIADIKCSFGDVKVYFDNAQIPSGRADIYLDVSFGNAILFIPENWRVINEAHVFLGDMGEKNRNIGSASPVVTIHGNVSFGDAQIFYVSAKNSQTT